MKVLLSDSFTEISVTTGTIQNVSDNIIELSSNETIDNGILLKPYDMFSFSDTTLYARCYNGGGGYVRVVPFELVTAGGSMQVLKRVFADISYDGSNLAFLSLTGEVLKYFNLPEEIYLRSIGTTFAPNFTWSALAYPNSENPNLNGKPVLVLHIKGDSLDSPYEDWGFCNLEDLIDLYVPADHSIAISNNSIKAAISNDTGNLLTLKNNGLFVPSDTILDSIPATVNGGLWYELEDNVPVIKLYHGGHTHTIATGDQTFKYLIVDSPFSSDLTDNCGVVWIPWGTVTVYNGATYFNTTMSSLHSATPVTFGNADFTLSFKCYVPPTSYVWTWLLGLRHYTEDPKQERVAEINLAGSGTAPWSGSAAIYDADGKRVFSTGQFLTFEAGAPKNIEMDYFHSDLELKIFLNGNLVLSSTLTDAVPRLSRYVWLNSSPSSVPTGGVSAAGSHISDFRIYDGIALHRENFTPE